MSDRNRAAAYIPVPRVVRRLVLAGLFAALTIVGAYISVPLPFSPVPIVLQNLFVLLAALLLGPRWASISIGLYLLLGLIGLPVLAEGTGGVAHFVGPTGGFLIGFLAAAAVCGLLSANPLTLSTDGIEQSLPERGAAAGVAAGTDAPNVPAGTSAFDAAANSGKRAARRAGTRRAGAGRDVLAVVAGSLVIYAFGVPWLKEVTQMSWPAAFVAGMLPFLPGDALKAVAAVLLAQAARPLVSRFMND